jgi:hypothetical protein
MITQPRATFSKAFSNCINHSLIAMWYTVVLTLNAILHK